MKKQNSLFCIIFIAIVLMVITAWVPAPQNEAGADFTYGDVSLHLPAGVATDATGETILAIGGEDSMLGPIPQLTQITFENYPVVSHLLTPMIQVFSNEEYLGQNPDIAQSFNALVTLVNEQKEPIPTDNNLPFIGFFNAGPLFKARVEYVDFQNGRGIRYLTMLGQAYGIIDNYNLIYTYQAISNDGTKYVLAIFPIMSDQLPDMADPNADLNAIIEKWEAYSADIAAKLVAVPDDRFLPNISDLDAMISSLLIAP